MVDPREIDAEAAHHRKIVEAVLEEGLGVMRRTPVDLIVVAVGEQKLVLEMVARPAIISKLCGPCFTASTYRILLVSDLC
jgi:hypothetical protein